ncbi:DUF2381 family protein [Archangium sp.]|uniref:DUF2381 family protein n=1 Tax=Archangium sp. TaxID=1872627 RepID=UPI00286BFFF4|nr:DUF2381 family protein [Archangium sp.]
MLAALVRLAPMVVPLVATAVWAAPEPVPARVLKARQVVLREGPGASAELHVHPGYLTTLAFEVDLPPGAVEVERPERVRLVGVVGPVVVLEAVEALAEGEQVRLTVTFSRGSAPVRAVLALVPHPSEVDAQVRVVLSERLAKAAEAEAREQSELMTRLLSAERVLGMKLEEEQIPATVLSEGVRGAVPWMYEWGGQRVVAVPVHNPVGAAPWEPRVVWLTSGSPGSKPKALSARMRGSRLMPGESGWVLIPWPDQKTGSFRLEVRERESGRGVRLTWERD